MTYRYTTKSNTYKKYNHDPLHSYNICDNNMSIQVLNSDIIHVYSSTNSNSTNYSSILLEYDIICLPPEL